MDAREIAESLDAERRKALLIAHQATYRPGIVAAQTRFQGRRNETGIEAANMLEGLARGGLLTSVGLSGSDMERTYSIEFKLTDLGRQVAKLLGE